MTTRGIDLPSKACAPGYYGIAAGRLSNGIAAGSPSAFACPPIAQARPHQYIPATPTQPRPEGPSDERRHSPRLPRDNRQDDGRTTLQNPLDLRKTGGTA